MINDGALIGRSPTDFIHGLVGGIPYEVRLPGGIWLPYVVTGEKQYNFKADSMGCVSFSDSSIIEVQEKFFTGIEVNYSDRWLAKMSGTTIKGNYLYKVADTSRNIGLVLESEYPSPKEGWTFDDYYADIPEPLLSTLKAKAKAWTEKWDVAYEWVELTPESFKKHLQHAPIQMVIPGHAVSGLALAIDGVMVTYLDSYEPYIKTRPLSDFSDALKIVLTPKTRMAQITTQQKGAELRIVLRASDINEFNVLCKVHGKNAAQIEEHVVDK